MKKNKKNAAIMAAVYGKSWRASIQSAIDVLGLPEEETWRKYIRYARNEFNNREEDPLTLPFYRKARAISGKCFRKVLSIKRNWRTK